MHTTTSCIWGAVGFTLFSHFSCISFYKFMHSWPFGWGDSARRAGSYLFQCSALRCQWLVWRDRHGRCSTRWKRRLFPRSSLSPELEQGKGSRFLTFFLQTLNWTYLNELHKTHAVTESNWPKSASIWKSWHETFQLYYGYFIFCTISISNICYYYTHDGSPLPSK